MHIGSAVFSVFNALLIEHAFFVLTLVLHSNLQGWICQRVLYIRHDIPGLTNFLVLAVYTLRIEAVFPPRQINLFCNNTAEI